MTIRAGMPKIQKDHLQLPKIDEIVAETPSAITVATAFDSVKRLMASARFVGGNHLRTRADPGAKMHPAASPFRNL